MDSSVREKQLRIGGMTCVNCENKIEKKLRNTAGVKSVKVRYSAGLADIAYDADIISVKDIALIIEKLGYKVLTGNGARGFSAGRTVGILIIIAALYVLLQQFGLLNLLVPSQLAQTNMSYGMLFVIGLMTSVHCVAMCGGINLSQCIPRGEQASDTKSRFSAYRPAFLYNLGRVGSYTAVGFIVGALGSAITFSDTLQGILKLIAGVLMVIMGINMLGIFPWLSKLTPKMPRFFREKADKAQAGSKSPLIVGLLNGLMPCGPLQAMQVYALSTGSPFTGALSMLLFSLGTVPLMFGFGALSTALGKRFAHKIMAVGAVLVVVLGLSMTSQGWSLSGLTLPDLSAKSTDSAQNGNIKIENGVQTVKSTLASGKYPSITVQAGVPVKWIINAPRGSINGCNNRMLIREYDIEYTFKTGENIIEFTPERIGKFQYTCWMGMIRGFITVTEDGITASATGTPEPTGPVPAGYTIPTDQVAIAKITEDEYGETIQTVAIELTGQGFSPAVVAVQSGLELEWRILNTAAENTLLLPVYAMQFPLNAGENPIYLYPAESLDFSTGDNAFYGYVKVVDDLDQVDIEAVKEEAGKVETMIWPPEIFDSSGGCCG